MLSVIIPTRDRATLLPTLIMAVQHQTLAPHELIVVDDGSVDQTPAVLKEWDEDVAILHTLGVGVSPARNAVLADASGDNRPPEAITW